MSDHNHQQQEQQSSSTSNGEEDFKCNICLNIASDAVVTLCGHLFCWPCLYTWLHFHSRHKECPVCKGSVRETKLIPVYSWGTRDASTRSRDTAAGSLPHIPPRPPAKRVESERQRRQRCHGNGDRHWDSAMASISGPNPASNGLASFRDYIHDAHMVGRETRASWLERLRAMREERLAWPLALMQGLTSRELMQQRRQVREAALSSRLMGEDSTMHGSSDMPTGLPVQPARQQHRPLPFGSCFDHILLPESSNHTGHYLSTMSSILSSMEVFAKALELSSSSSLRRSVPANPHVFQALDEEQAMWQSSMRALLAQMERLMVQLQSIQPRNSHPAAAANSPALTNGWSAASTRRRRCNNGSMTERSHVNSGGFIDTACLSPHLHQVEDEFNLARVIAGGQGHRSVFSLAAYEGTSTGRKSRKRWDVTRMSR